MAVRSMMLYISRRPAASMEPFGSRYNLCKARELGPCHPPRRYPQLLPPPKQIRVLQLRLPTRDGRHVEEEHVDRAN